MQETDTPIRGAGNVNCGLFEEPWNNIYSI